MAVQFLSRTERFRVCGGVLVNLLSGLSRQIFFAILLNLEGVEVCNPFPPFSGIWSSILAFYGEGII